MRGHIHSRNNMQQTLQEALRWYSWKSWY